MSESETPETLAAAILALQADLPRVGKNREADTGKYKYKYTGLDLVSDAILPKLNALGLYWTTAPTLNDQGLPVLHYELTHAKSGEKIDGDYPLPASGSSQDFGSAITYARRYALCAVTGVAPAGDDNDGKPATKQAAAVRPAPVVTITPADEAAVDEWLGTIRDAETIPALQAAWEGIGKAGLAGNQSLKDATNKRKKELQ